MTFFERRPETEKVFVCAGNEEIEGRRVCNCHGPKAKEKSSIKHGGGGSVETGSAMPSTSETI